MGTVGTETSSVLQSYLDLVWHDGMTSYDGKVISYDALGNPISYNGTSYVWEGRQLKEVTNAEGKTQFEYDANGLRTQKRIYRPDGRLLFTANYIWENGILSSQTLVVARYNLDGTSASDIVFSSKIIYDDNNQPVGYIVNSDAVYMFVRNLQGDVIALIDDEGDTILEYSYDAWGKLEYKFTNPNMDETAAMFLTSLCPLTYRGYNYDFSTGLYYLQSRYYNPEWGRLLNTDDPQMVLNMVGDDHGANQFVYCMNNPINYSDHSGYWGGDVHYDLTEKWARDFFYSWDARAIAQGNVDMDAYYSPFPPFMHPIDGSWNWVENQRYHFNRNSRYQLDSRKSFAMWMLLVSAMTWVSAEITFEKSKKNESDYNLRDFGYFTALTYLGNGLHSIQDVEGHGNIGYDDKYFTQHIVSSGGRYIHKADDINYSWTNRGKTALVKDSGKKRLHQTEIDTISYFIIFSAAVSLFREEYNLPDIRIDSYERWNFLLK